MIGTMGSVAGADAVADGDGAAGPGAAGVVSRPRLVGRLGAQARVSVVSAPPGSGKTVLLRSWISWAGVAGSAAWVPAGRGERDPQRFWLSVLAALRQTVPGSALVRELTAAPDLDGWAITERLLTDLAPLDDEVWLVIDDVHELGPDALRQLELLIMRAPPGLRFVLAARHDVRLGCTGYGWRASWPRSASRICGSPWPRPRSCSPPPGCGCPRWRRWWSGPRGGRRGCGWRR
jgi:LuxR family transcriptional regulator, maltose regulon positive regulatory protein